MSKEGDGHFTEKENCLVDSEPNVFDYDNSCDRSSKYDDVSCVQCTDNIYCSALESNLLLIVILRIDAFSF